ncbi:oligosaccharide flippase family protein [Sphingomonas sp.]|uniref:oligosaccharide flippase family protein n=1 Tax=Sphingomonas sp. TaxID=28214 RepID=UPI0033402AF8
MLGIALFAVLTPVYFHAIGAERYGVITVILSLSMYVATFNFGLGPALTYQVAGPLRDDIPAQSEAFWSAMAFSTPLGLVASIIIFGLLPIGLADLMHMSPTVRTETGAAFLPLVGIGLCTILSANVRGVWHGRQAFVTLSVFGAFETVLTILMPVLAALYWSPDIGVLLYATLWTRSLLLVGGTLVLAGAKFQRLYPRISLLPVRAMLGYGGWVTLSTLVETVVSSADRLVLGAVSGAGQIPVYSIPLSLTSRSMILPFSLISTIFPKLVGADAEREHILLDKTVRFVLLLTPGYLVVGVAAAPLLRYWISRDFADQATWSLQILAIAFWIEGVSTIYYSLLNARRQTRANFLIGSGAILPYGLALVAGAWAFGAAGVATVFLLRTLGTLIARALWSDAHWSEVRAISVNLAPLLIGVLVAPHAWSTLTVAQVGLGSGAVLASVAMCLWTRPSDMLALARAILPSRRSKIGVLP